jgi:hypothetical protein
MKMGSLSVSEKQGAGVRVEGSADIL